MGGGKNREGYAFLKPDCPKLGSPGNRPRDKDADADNFAGKQSQAAPTRRWAGEQPLSWALSGELPHRQGELSPAGDQGVGAAPAPQSTTGVGGGGVEGRSWCYSLAPAARHVHGQSGHQRPETAPRTQVLAAGSRAGASPRKWEGEGKGRGADVSAMEVVGGLVGFPCRSRRQELCKCSLPGGRDTRNPSSARAPTEPHLPPRPSSEWL